MKQLIIILLLVMSVAMQAQNIRAYMSHNVFYSPKEGPFLETYVQVDGTSVKWEKGANNKFDAQIELTLIFEQDSNIIDFSKVIIKSPEVEDSAGMRIEFMNTQRFALKNGMYDVKIKIDDLKRLDFSMKALIEKPDNYSPPEKRKKFQKG